MSLAVAAGVGVVSGVYIFKPMVTDSDTRNQMLKRPESNSLKCGE